MRRNKNDITTKTGETYVDEMSEYQLSRWIALYEAINIISKTAIKKGKQFNFTNLKQPALEEYINVTGDIIYRELSGSSKIKE